MMHQQACSPSFKEGQQQTLFLVDSSCQKRDEPQGWFAQESLRTNQENDSSSFKRQRKRVSGHVNKCNVNCRLSR